MYRDPRWGWPILAGFLAALPTAAAGAAAAGPAAATSHAFSHDAWTAVLERFVDAEGQVDYQSLAADRGDLDRYLAALREVSPETRPDLFPRREEALAYYLNAYNAYVVHGVLERWPDVDSVWPNPLAAFKFFVWQKIDLGGQKLHLKGLEDKKVRAGFGDPRIHAILNCASKSCPRLRRRAVEPDTLEADLEEAMRELVSDPRHLRFEAAAKTVHVSKIFDWFDEDFLAYERQQGNREPSLLDAVNRFRPADGRLPPGTRIEFLTFDKGLNRQ